MHTLCDAWAKLQQSVGIDTQYLNLCGYHKNHKEFTSRVAQAGLRQNREREQAGYTPYGRSSWSLALPILIMQGKHARD